MTTTADPTTVPNWLTCSSQAWTSDQTPTETFAAAWLRVFNGSPPNPPNPADALEIWDGTAIGAGAIYRLFADDQVTIAFNDGRTGISVVNSGDGS